jgi:putative transposase
MSHFRYRRAYRRNLPHIQPQGATFFITFRLAGSLPETVVNQWKRERIWLEHLAQTNLSHYNQIKSDFDRIWFAKFESLLDQTTAGPLWLKDKRVSSMVAESLHYRDWDVYRLDAFTIMANHVHTVFKPLPLARRQNPELIVRDEDPQYHSLATIMQSLKGYTAFQANRLLGREGEFWAHESYDHWIRDDVEWQRIVAYVMNNPVKAHYVQRWQDWRWSYARGQWR